MRIHLIVFLLSYRLNTHESLQDKLKNSCGSTFTLGYSLAQLSPQHFLFSQTFTRVHMYLFFKHNISIMLRTSHLKPLTAPLIPPVRDAKTMTCSEFPTYQGTKIEGIWGESPPNPLLRPEGGAGGEGVGVSNDWCIILDWRAQNPCSLSCQEIENK